jgi:adenylate cyclase, class 2
MLEIELKVRVDSLGPVKEKLIARNARACGRVHEHDVYYNAPHRDFEKTDEALRMRYTDRHGEAAVVTYKGPKIPSLELKVREELNTGIESGRIFEQMIQKLGFVRVSEVDKVRENYQLGEATVSLDTVDRLGTFVEIELAGDVDKKKAMEQVKGIAQELGVEGEPILTSYLELLLSKR